MKPLRILLIAMAVVVVAGTIAGAAPGVHGKPTPTPSVTVSGPPSPEPTETESPEPAETESPDISATDLGENGTAPDFSKCEGLTGLDNAICRHKALLKVQPDNPGLANSLEHLKANRDAQAARQAARAAGAHGPFGTHGNSGSHGPTGS